MSTTEISKRTVPGTNATVKVEKLDGNRTNPYIVTRDAGPGFNYLLCGRATEAEATAEADMLYADAVARSADASPAQDGRSPITDVEEDDATPLRAGLDAHGDVDTPVICNVDTPAPTHASMNGIATVESLAGLGKAIVSYGRHLTYTPLSVYGTELRGKVRLNLNDLAALLRAVDGENSEGSITVAERGRLDRAARTLTDLYDRLTPPEERL